MKTLNEIANIVGPELWSEIEPHFADQLDRCNADKASAVEAAKLAIQINLDALVTAAEAAIAPLEATILDGVAMNAGNMENLPTLVSPIRAVIEQAKTYTTAARRAKIEAELAAAQAAAAEAAAKLAALG